MTVVKAYFGVVYDQLYASATKLSQQFKQSVLSFDHENQTGVLVAQAQVFGHILRQSFTY